MSNEYGDYQQDPRLITGRLRGYRAWYIQPNGLKSTGWPYVWENQQITANCVAPSARHDAGLAPVASCTCGIYAIHTWNNTDFLEKIQPNTYWAQYWSAIAQWRSIQIGIPIVEPQMPQVTDLIRNGPISSVAAGVVEAWGTTVIGTKGFRAKHARIVALTVGPEPPKSTWIPGVNKPIDVTISRFDRFGIGYSYTAGSIVTAASLRAALGVGTQWSWSPLGAGTQWSWSPTSEPPERAVATITVTAADSGREMALQVPLPETETIDIPALYAEAVKIAEQKDHLAQLTYREEVAKLETKYQVPIYTNITDMLDTYPPIPVNHILDPTTT